MIKGKKVGLRKKLAPEGNVFLSFISAYYKIEMNRLWLYTERGFTINDILLAVNLGVNRGISFELLLRDRERIKLVYDLKGKKYQGREVVFTL